MSLASRSDSFDGTIGNSSIDDCKEVTQYSLPSGHIEDLQLTHDDENLELFRQQNNGYSQTSFQNSTNCRQGDDVTFNIEGHVNVNITTNHVNSQGVVTEDDKEKNERLRAQQLALRIEKFQHRFRYIYLPSTALFLLILLIMSLAVFWNNIFPKRFEFQPVNPKTDYLIFDYPVYNGTNWGALAPEEELSLLPLPSPLVIISSSNTESCNDFLQCANITQAIQYDHIKKGFGDINFNFLIGGEGGIYVGRGWQYENTIRFKSVVIAFIGDFSKGYATNEAINASLALIGEGVKLGKISEDYKLIGENQTSAQRFYSPGYHLFPVIKKFDHYFSGTML